jgi:hypothetical protein
LFTSASTFGCLIFVILVPQPFQHFSFVVAPKSSLSIMASKADASATAPHVDNSTSPPPASIQTAAVDDEHGAALELDTLAPSTASHVGNSTPPPSSVITQDGAALAQDQPPSVNRQQAPRGTNNDGNTKQAREAERAKQIDLVDE